MDDTKSGGDQHQLRRSLNMRKQFFRRKKICPFSGSKDQPIDYKDIRLLSKFTSERGKIMPSRITGVCRKKQRELSIAVRRARFLALMPYVNM